jgi:hypothetical protein
VRVEQERDAFFFFFVYIYERRKEIVRSKAETETFFGWGLPERDENIRYVVHTAFVHVL